MCVKENYKSEVLLICVFIALLWGAGNNLATPPGQNCGLQVVEQFFFFCVWEADYVDFKRRNESEWTRPRAMVNQVNVFLHIRKGFSSQSDANGKSKEA